MATKPTQVTIRSAAGKLIFYVLNLSRRLITSYLYAKYSASSKSIGLGVKFNGICQIISPEELVIESNVHIGDNAFFSCGGGLFIGENTHISRNLVVYTVNHDYSGDRLPYDERQILKPVSIGRNAWIGMNVTVLPGTHIGEGAIIGAGSVVAGKVPPFSIYGAQIATKIGERDIEHYRRLDNSKAYGGPNGEPL